MERPRIIKHKYLPTRAPFITALFAYLCLDYWQATGWVHGVVWTIMAIWFIAWVAEVVRKEEIDL